MIFRPRQLTPKQFARKYAQDRGINLHDWFGPTRYRKVAHARQDCMVEIRNRYQLSEPATARIFNRDHTTFRHAIKAVAKRKAQTEAAQ